MRTAALLALTLGLCTSCLSPPPVEVDASCGRVRAHSHSEALHAAELLDDLHGRVCTTLPATSPAPVEVWVQEELRIFWWARPAPEVNAINYRPWRRLHLERDSTSLPEDMAHELVHLLIDRSWHTMPPAVEEGLADHVAQELTPSRAAQIRAFRLMDGLSALGPVELRFRLPDRGQEVAFSSAAPTGSTDPDRVFEGLLSEISPHSHSEGKQALYGFGFLAVDRIVDRIGYEGLHGMCLSAGERGLAFVPAEELRTAARLEGGATAWRRAILEELGPLELAVLAEHECALLARLLTRAFRSDYPKLDGVTFLEYERPLWGFASSGLEIALGEVPGLRGALRGEWPTPGRPSSSATFATAADDAR